MENVQKIQKIHLTKGNILCKHRKRGEKKMKNMKTHFARMENVEKKTCDPPPGF